MLQGRGGPSRPAVMGAAALRYHSGPEGKTSSETHTMAGLSKDAPLPTEIKLHQKSRRLEVAFADGRAFELPCEFLRVYSPSAEVRGHGPGQEVLQTGKRDVEITRIEPVGTYAVQLVFSDGHDTGIYSWDLLYDYGVHRDEMWARYLKRLEEAGASRDPAAAPVAAAAPRGSCGGH